ncbi:MAG: RNA-binding domain-containing protein [Thermoplasmata archaeon]|nr:RNA-binding domain-containing protein [Thermoplasmata archaeon]
MTLVSISCPVNPSEDPEKVRGAVLAIFPDAEIELSGGRYTGTAPGLGKFSQLIRRDRILDATRAVLVVNTKGNATRMALNKQVATVGKVSFAERRPVLGAIEVTIEDDDINALIDRVAPITVDGEEVKA